MAEFKNMKMRINNPDHSKAVQEWLFGQGYCWSGSQDAPLYTEAEYLFTGSYGALSFADSGQDRYFQESCKTEIDVQHLDPHLFRCQESDVVPSKTYTEKPPVKDELKSLSTQLKQLDKAIASHDNKQNKRKTERQRVMDKIEGMLPEGYGIVLTGGVASLPQSWEESWGEDIVVGSVWECLEPDHCGGLTSGNHYKVLSLDGDGDPIFEDNHHQDNWFKDDFLSSFKRVS